MALRVSDIINLKGLSGLKLEAGKEGLFRHVSSAGILDYEYVTSAPELANPLFNNDSFVISSLLFAKDNPDLILPAIRQLVGAGISAFAYKEVFYQQLPQEVLDYADEHALPVFRFGADSFFEDIIFEIMDAVQLDDTRILTENRIQYILENQLNQAEASELVRNLSLKFRRYIQAAYIKSRPGQPELNIQRLLRSYYHSNPLRKKIMLGNYNDGLILLMTSSGNSDIVFHSIFREYMETSGIDSSQVFSTFSSTYESLYHLPECIRECCWAYEAAREEGVQTLHFQDSGIWRYLVPLYEQPSLADFAERYLKPLEARPDLLETAQVWVQTGGDLLRTADILDCHQNTVRYRIGRIRNLAESESAGAITDFQLYERLSAALKVRKLHQTS